MSCRRIKRSAGASRIDREACERGLSLASLPPWRAQNPPATRRPARSTSGPAGARHPPHVERPPAGPTARPTTASSPSRRIPRGAPPIPRDAEAGKVDIGAGRGSTSPPHVVPRNPAVSGRRRDRPRGQRARPITRVASPLAHPEPRRESREAGEVDGQQGWPGNHIPGVAPPNARRANAGGIDRDADDRVLLLASRPLRLQSTPSPRPCGAALSHRAPGATSQGCAWLSRQREAAH